MACGSIASRSICRSRLSQPRELRLGTRPRPCRRTTPRHGPNRLRPQLGRRVDATLYHFAPAVSVAGCLAGRLGGLPADSPGPRRSHPANAGGRRCRHRYCRRASRLRARRSAGPAIRELLAWTVARRHGTFAALQSECRAHHRAGVPVHPAADAGGADCGSAAGDSGGSSLGPAPQSLGRPGAQFCLAAGTVVPQLRAGTDPDSGFRD